MFKVLAIVLLLAVGLGATGYAVLGGMQNASSGSQYLSAAVSRGNVEKTAVATGSVGVATQYGLAFGSPPAFMASSTDTGSGSGSGTSSYLVANVSVVPGDTVTNGQELASADTTQLRLAADTARSNLAAAQTKLKTDNGGVAADVKASAQDSVTSAQLSAQAAVQSAASTAAGNSLSIAQAQLQLGNAQRQYATDKKGPDSATIDAAKDNITSAQLALTSAQQSIVTTRSTNEQSIAAAQAAIDAAQQAISDTAASNDLALQGAQNAVESATQNLTDTRTQNDAAIANAQAAFDAASAQFIADANPSSGKPDQSKLTSDQNAINQAQAGLTSAQQKADSSLHGAQDQIDTAQSNLQAAQLKADQATRNAQSALTSAQGALKTTQLKADQAELAAENQATSAQNALTAAQHAYELKIQPSEVTLQADLQAIANAQLALKNARLNAQKASQTASNQVKQARQSVTAAQHGYDSKVAPVSDATIASDEAAVATAQNALDTATSALDMARLTAPVGGTVVAVNITAGSIAPSGYAITIQSTDMQVVADFTETDLPSLALKQAATVSVTAVSAFVDGTVTSIAPQATSGTSGGVVTYAVTISLTNAPANVRVGMSAQATVTTAQAVDVLTVPSVALRGANGNYSVLVLDEAGVPTSVAVAVGLVSNGLAEIQGGLNEGERVVTGTVSARQGTTGAGTGNGIAIPGGFGGGGNTFIVPGGGRGGNGRGTNGGTGTGGGATTP